MSSAYLFCFIKHVLLCMLAYLAVTVMKVFSG